MPKQVELALARSCVRIDSKAPRFKAQVAVSEEELAKGLSRRPQELGAQEAHLFWFEQPRMAAFWMKETWIPLLLLYVDSSGKVVDQVLMSVETNPSSPERTYPSSRLVRAALEVSPNTRVPTGSQLCFRAR